MFDWIGNSLICLSETLDFSLFVPGLQNIGCFWRSHSGKKRKMALTDSKKENKKQRYSAVFCFLEGEKTLRMSF